MSRIGKLPIPITKGASASVVDGALLVKGPKGELTQPFEGNAIEVKIADDKIVVERRAEDRRTRSLHGLYRSLFFNMVQGVTEGFRRVLEINGVGYRAELQGKNLALFVGFPSAKTIAVPDSVQLQVEKNTRITLTSHDKQAIGQLAADIRRVRPPEPYKGKGIKFEDEVIRKKAGKTTAA